MRRAGLTLFAVTLSSVLVMVQAKQANADSQALMLPWLAGMTHNITVGNSYDTPPWHTGIYYYAIDWNLAAGTGVAAVLSGSAYTGFDSCGGYYVAINHGSNLWSYYGHLDATTINSWVHTSDPNNPQHVSQGQQIALSDTSGAYPTCITGAHLHFHMLENATGPFSGSAHLPEPMTAPNGSSYSNFGAYGSGRGTSPDYTSTFALPHAVHATGTVAWWDTTVTPNVERVNAFYLGSDGYAYINYLDSGHWYWLAGSRPSPSVTLLGGVGVVSYWDTSANVERVNAFYFASDGNAYVYYFDASTGRYFWTGGKHPAGHGVLAGAGTVQYWVGTTLAVNSFELAGDGASYIEYWDAGTQDWQFTAGLQPAGVTLVGGAGAQQWWDTSQRVNAYLIGSDGYTYKEFYSGTAWTLAAGSKPVATAVSQMVGATTWWDELAQTERVYAYAIGSDGNAYRVSFATVGDNGNWSTGSQPAASLVGGASAIQWIDTAQQADAFFQGSDGKVYRLFYSAGSGSWSWDNGTKPVSNYLAGGIGAVAYMYNGTQAVDAFLMGADGAPYIEYLYGSWGLTQEGNLPGSPLLS